MRFFVFSFYFLFVTLSAVRAHADSVSSAELTDIQITIDNLYNDLKAEPDNRSARRIITEIRKELKREGGATADLLIEWAKTAAIEKKYSVSLDLLNQAITLYPNYIEALNNRSLLHLIMENQRKALADIALALAIEPRHLGSLHGLAGLLRAAGLNKESLDIYRTVLELYPRDHTAQRAFMRLTEELSDPTL